jgi:hypothetical protein
MYHLFYKILFMKKVFFIALLYCHINIEMKGQESPMYFSKVKDASGNDMLLGRCALAALQQHPFADWYNRNYAAYTVDTATCNYIRPLLKNKKLTIFLGTWCGDSRREVPRMIKMLECCNFDFSNLTLIMVSNDDSLYKQSPAHEEAGRNIVRVPTIIVEEYRREEGRIVEYPVSSLEKDLLSILSKENYVPNYSKKQMMNMK